MASLATYLSDVLLAGGAIGAALYCGVLARRLRRFNDLERGMGGAVAMLSAQVDDMTRTLGAVRSTADASTTALGDVTGRAEAAAKRLELLVAALHDLPDPSGPPGSAARRPPAEAEPLGAARESGALPVAERPGGSHGRAAAPAMHMRAEPRLTSRVPPPQPARREPGEPPLFLRHRPSEGGA